MVGFDLDMTLIDSRYGIGAVYRALSEETGVHIDVDAVTGRLGPPVADELANWFPPDQVERLADRYRELYPRIAIADTPLLPGVVEAFAAVRDVGGRVLVVTAKLDTSAQLHLAHLGVEADVLVGWAWADGKRDALRRHEAVAYVGDHVADMRAARDAPTVAVGVTTGSSSRAELVAAGADVILADLREFPNWWEHSNLLGCRTHSR
jgi:phosphoglycolate phosphatase